jgi:isopentenyl-diphosphate delta-isomerase
VEHERVELFTAQLLGGAAVFPDPAEVMEVRWVRLEALKQEIAAAPGAFTPWLRIYMAEHAGPLFGRAA